MRRRSVLAGAGSVFTLVFAGCLDDLGSTDEDDTAGTGDENNGGTDVESRTKKCEEQYIRTEVVTRDDETIDDSLQPTVINTESRDEGTFVELRTEFGVTRETEGGPDEHLDYQVTAYYLITDETVYRTEGEEAEGDPRDGITMDCNSEAGDETTNGDGADDTEYSTSYRILVEPPTESAENEDICEFDELPDEAQTEFSRAIDGVDFESEDRANHEMDESPALLDTDCYSGYIEFEDKYYWVGVEVSSG